MLDVSKVVDTSIKIMRENVSLRSELKREKEKNLVLMEILELREGVRELEYAFQKEKAAQ